MEREGEVIAVQGENLVVQFCRPTDCEKCHGCMGGSAQRQLLVHGQAQVGDRAVVEMPTQKIVKASALAYLFPLLGLMAGLFLGSFLSRRRRRRRPLWGACWAWRYRLP